MQVKVVAVIEETPAVKVFELVSSSSGERLPPHTAGAHVNVHVELNDGTLDQRSYSIINPGSYDGFYRIAVQREKQGRGGSAYMHDVVRVGDLIEIEAPRNHFELAGDAKEHLLIAGGIGITPILCMARTLVLGAIPFALHYVARDPELMPFKKEVLGVCGERATLRFDGGDPAKGIDLPSLLGERRVGLHAYVCGPAGMIEAVLALCRENGWPESAVHFELFNNPQARQQADQAIEVTLLRSGVTLKVEPGVSILDAILASGIEVDYDCKVGECGTCLTSVLEGVPLHRDYYLNSRERSEGKAMCTCVSWSSSPRLVLDI